MGVLLSTGRFKPLADKLLDPFLFLRVARLDQISEHLAEVKVPDDFLLLELLVADGAFMLAIDNLKDAVFAKCVPTLGDIGVIIHLEANYALCELTYNVIDADFHLLVVL